MLKWFRFQDPFTEQRREKYQLDQVLWRSLCKYITTWTFCTCLHSSKRWLTVKFMNCKCRPLAPAEICHNWALGLQKKVNFSMFCNNKSMPICCGQTAACCRVEVDLYFCKQIKQNAREAVICCAHPESIWSPRKWTGTEFWLHKNIAITKISQPNASKLYLAAYFKLFSIVYDNSQCSVRILIFKKYNCIASLVTDRGNLQQFSQLIGLDLKKLAQQRHSKGP